MFRGHQNDIWTRYICDKTTVRRDIKVQAEGIQLNNNHVIQDLQKSGIYKYLGIEDGECIKENS